MGALYEKDVLAWSIEQARYLREGRFDLLDIEHLADEVEDVGKSEKRELRSRLAVLLAHLLKWQFQPDRRGASWTRTIREQRRAVLEALDETPSLNPLLADAHWRSGTWGQAVVQAAQETGLADFPDDCPWSIDDQVLKDGWLPD